MKYYPVFLRVEGGRCVVVGGGPIAERKATSLREAGACVIVVSPEVTPVLEQAAADGEIELRRRPYRREDLKGAVLAYAATDDDELHARIAADAAAEGVLLNVVDRPRWCDFIVPSVARRGGLLVAVSTSGRSPALARRVRQDVERMLGPEYERALEVLARLREHLRQRSLSFEQKQRIFGELLDSDLLGRLRDGDWRGVDHLLARHAGAGVSAASLGVAADE